MNYTKTTTLPTPEEYMHLRAICGLYPKHIDAATTGLRNSMFFTGLRDGEKLIAMGRMIGDGGCFAQVVDIAVHPDYQKQGLSRKIMEEISSHIKTLPPSCFVSLFADVDYLYTKFGFALSEKSKGMYLVTN
jgi:GNAT superfamily N-acetyltransferase